MPRGRRDGKDGLDGALVGQGWDGPTLSGAGMGAPPLALEGRRAVGSGGWEKLRRSCKGAESRARIISVGEAK